MLRGVDGVCVWGKGYKKPWRMGARERRSKGAKWGKVVEVRERDGGGGGTRLGVKERRASEKIRKNVGREQASGGGRGHVRA